MKKKTRFVAPPSVDRHCWQCSGCRLVFLIPWQAECPECGRVDYWSGSVNPKALERAWQQRLLTTLFLRAVNVAVREAEDGLKEIETAQQRMWKMDAEHHRRMQQNLEILSGMR